MAPDASPTSPPPSGCCTCTPPDARFTSAPRPRRPSCWPCAWPAICRRPTSTAGDEASGRRVLVDRLVAAGVVAPGTRVRADWEPLAATLVAPGEASAPAAGRRGETVSQTLETLGKTDTPVIAPASSPGRWPAALARLVAVWQQAEATLAAPSAAPASARAASAPLDADLVRPAEPAPTPAAQPRRAPSLPGGAGLSAAMLSTHIAARGFADRVAAPRPVRPMIAAGAPQSLATRLASLAEEPATGGGVMGRTLVAGLAPAAAPEVERPYAGLPDAAYWPALVAPSGPSDVALGATEAWAGVPGPGGRLAGPDNVERALLTWSAAAVRDAESRATESRVVESLGSIGQLVRSNAVEMGPRQVDVPMRASPGGHLFGDRGPAGLSAPDLHASRVLVEPGARAAEQALRSTPGQRPRRQSETSEDAKQRLSDQVGEELSPEETERLAREIIDRLKRELEFDAARLGDDAWD
ncbi:MAG: hypothetical protein R3F43_20470 [bacterium]